LPEKKTILVVEDDADLCHLLCELLESDGYRAEPAYNGLGAVRRVGECPPDALVLDVMLPDMSGFEVCQNLKLRRETNLIPILMLTAMSDPASVRSGLRVGANRYLTKPFDPSALLREVGQALRHRDELAGHQTHTSVELHLRSDSKSREQLNDVLSELFLLTPLSDAAIHQIRYAALEMIENAVEWGNRRQKDLMVTIAYEVTDQLVRFVITDQGPGFDPRNVPHAAHLNDPAAHLGIREKLGLRNGGFGILISQGMVDEFTYNTSGNQVTMVKYFEK